MSIEHFKKRLIQKHQKPLLEAPPPFSPKEELDEETSSNSSSCSGVSNSNDQKQEKKKESALQSKIARKRTVCRSKFRHDSLKIFKLGTSFPTSLCKSKEPYNVSTEKNLQLCCENKEALPYNNNNTISNNNLTSKDDTTFENNKFVNNESITEQIIYSIDSNRNNGKDLQRSYSYDSCTTSKLPGKHILPPTVPEIPFKKQNSSLRRNSNENQQIFPIKNTKNDTSFKIPVFQNTYGISTERISPDSTSAVEPTVSSHVPTMLNISPYIPKGLPLNVSLPSSPSKNPIMITNGLEKTRNFSPSPSYSNNFPNFPKGSDPQRYVESILTKGNKNYPQFTCNSTDAPINLSVKEKGNLLKLLDPHFYAKYQHILDVVTTGLDELKVDSLPGGNVYRANKESASFPFPHIHNQMNRLNNSNNQKFVVHEKVLKISVARSMLPMSRRLMQIPFNAEILAIFNYFYQYLQLTKITIDVSTELKQFIDDLTNEIISFLTKMLFNDTGMNSTLRRYTIKILTLDLDSHVPLINDVLHIIPKKYFDSNWMRYFLAVLKRGGSKQRNITQMNSTVNLNPYQAPFKNKKPRGKSGQKTEKVTNFKPSKRNPQRTDPAKFSYKPKSTNVAEANRKVSSQSKLTPPIQMNYSQESDKNNLITANKTDSAGSIFDKTTVIVQDNSMEVTISDKDAQIPLKNSTVVDKSDVTVEKLLACKKEIKNEPVHVAEVKTENNDTFSEDLNLFKELLRNEDKEVYQKVLKKLVSMKQTSLTTDVITIEDEEDSPKKTTKLQDGQFNIKTEDQDISSKNDVTKTSDIVIIEIDSDNHSINENASDCNQNYIQHNVIKEKSCEQSSLQEAESITTNMNMINNKSTDSGKLLNSLTNSVEDVSRKSQLIVIPEEKTHKTFNDENNLVSTASYNKSERRKPISKSKIDILKHQTSQAKVLKTNKNSPGCVSTQSSEEQMKRPIIKSPVTRSQISSNKNQSMLTNTSFVEDISSDEDDSKPYTKKIGYDCKISNTERFFNGTNLNICHLISKSENSIKPDPIAKFIYTMPVGPQVPLQSEKNKSLLELTHFNETKESLSCKLKINNESSFVRIPLLYSSNQCNNMESVSPQMIQSPVELTSPSTELLGKTGVNWKNWITEERNKSFLNQQRSSDRRQSIETISSVGSDYSPNVDHEENYVKIRIDKKWYRVSKSVMDSIPKGKMTYDRERNHLERYFDDTQIEQFIKNVNVNLVAASDFFKQMKERVGGYLCDNIFLTPFEVPERNEVIQLSSNICFATDDNISDPELYVQEVEKVKRFVPTDFFGFYKYVTGYQIIHNHDPISFQMFLTMHNTNRIKSFYKRLHHPSNVAKKRHLKNCHIKIIPTTKAKNIL